VESPVKAACRLWNELRAEKSHGREGWEISKANQQAYQAGLD